MNFFNSLRFVLAELLFLLVDKFVSSAEAVQCYCTYKECGSAFCESEWCLVGFKKHDIGRGTIYQNCASDDFAKTMHKCRQDIDQWDEVCKCNKNRCNTYHFFRESLDLSNGEGPMGMTIPTIQDDQSSWDPDPYGYGSKGFANSQLVILLICVPLGVGVVAVVFVFINYHCKL